uniref:Uncharacterized protein n=1 Tax=Florenciella parvula TaxID=236787 RepID=A0A6T7DTH4_9STRA|mmetsp:Transcript_24398/g.50402  ORF Transcript_24398/g.50402 Transcript_24398/m.50402 type:complete len:226 (+) Transcript_24398:68-745(+)|eukprot:CAMPEP_0182530888 /NCGR_PEP_ID=MMETSP1323-20130603/7114_1 /TAXON_ID=236787 /ORGANISM="Florenciella parvula, Strain RCC1693" /LENGTH=225 /DNA_ID=CAMNT_0024740289 /DNA_START=68 /DNA_END=745 /DNA_ORIENTATION=-
MNNWRFLLVVLGWLAPCSAFQPVLRSARASTAVRAEIATGSSSSVDVKSMPGVTNPVGFFDPFGICEDADPQIVYWLRAAELKHGRVTMLATTGWLVNTGGTFWPGTFDGEHTWASLGSQPLHAWANMAADRPSAPYEILIFAGIVETYDELRGERGEKHYTQGGPIGLQFDPLGFQTRYSPEQMLRQQNKELNNGRLAMLGMASFLAAAQIKGSVPFLPTIFEG